MLSGPTHPLFACNTQWKCIGGLPHPPTLGAYVLNGRPLSSFLKCNLCYTIEGHPSITLTLLERMPNQDQNTIFIKLLGLRVTMIVITEIEKDNAKSDISGRLSTES